MDLIHITIFTGLALVYNLIPSGRWRAWALTVTSLMAIYWLQPDLPVRWLDFFLPTITIMLAVIGWLYTRQKPDDEPMLSREDWVTLSVALGLILLLLVPRYINLPLALTSRPPTITTVLLVLAVLGGLAVGIWRVIRSQQKLLTSAVLFIIVIFAFVKTESLSILLAGWLRTLTGQDASIASTVDIGWLGFSYVAFRLIHTLRDRQTGLLPDVSLREYLTYVIFFPAYTAGPIDRAERFAEDYRELIGQNRWNSARITEGGARIATGLFKKFVIADSIALIALNASSADQAQSAGALWLLLYAYAFRLFFDFSGYSDIAIGISILFGIKLPENFDRPYLKNNIMAFWQSWHMTLSNWVRFYVFSPLSRSLLRRKPKPPNEIIMLICHLSTMAVIGLWHGVSWPFLIWGLWHGLGLWVHKLWTDRTRRWYLSLKNKPRLKQAWTAAGVLITFHFVVLGWVWFALSDLNTALSTFIRLFGGA